ncbi:MAG: hypothetical protein JWM33_2195 [Caulobacteraceae bacterium]|nr:hypothetical protein [Caulobacteraceae bacterium]
MSARLALALTATAATLAACAAPSGYPRLDAKVSHLINYTPRDDARLAARYPDWARLEYLGPQHDPINALWLSPAPLSQNAPFNDFLLLTPAAWSRVHLRLATTPCPPVAPPDYTAVRLTIAAAGRVSQRCLASPPTTCAYDAVLRTLSPDEMVRGELDWARPFFNVCDTGFAG